MKKKGKLSKIIYTLVLIQHNFSESLLNGFKKKNKKHKMGSNEHKANTQSDLFPSRIDTQKPSEMAHER